ncbi:MAG: glycosyltransferase family 4 protein [Ignavibacteria bacterium]|nr:glycosyltransferase family 4 protein [Ignavibacteria bacterium]
MKILFLFAGIPHYYKNVLNKLNTVDGIDISVLISANSSKNIGNGVHFEDEGVNFKILRKPEYKSFYGKTFLKDFVDIVENEKPDIIVAIWPYILGFLFYPHIRRLVKKRKIKLIYKDIPFQLPLFKDAILFKVKQFRTEESVVSRLSIARRLQIFFNSLMMKYLYKIIDAHVNYVEDAFEVLGSYGVCNEKIFIINNSPDTELLLQARKEAEVLEPFSPFSYHRLIHVGRLVKWKRVDLIIDALPKILESFPDTELLILGGGAETNNLKKIVDRNNLNHKIYFVGPIYDPIDLGRYFLSCSIYILAGMGGLSINEAMVFGKPVVCSVCDGTEKKLVRDDFNGKYFMEGSSNDLAETVIELFSDINKLRIMGLNSEQIIKNEINIKTVIQGYVNAFNYVTSNKFNLINSNNL